MCSQITDQVLHRQEVVLSRRQDKEESERRIEMVTALKLQLKYIPPVHQAEQFGRHEYSVHLLVRGDVPLKPEPESQKCRIKITRVVHASYLSHSVFTFSILIVAFISQMS